MRYNVFKNSAKQRSAAMLPHNAVNADTPSLRSEEFDKAITAPMAGNCTHIHMTSNRSLKVTYFGYVRAMKKKYE